MNILYMCTLHKCCLYKGGLLGVLFCVPKKGRPAVWMRLFRRPLTLGHSKILWSQGRNQRGGVVDELGNGGMGLYQPSNERQLRLQTADRRHLAKSTLHDNRPFRLGIAVTFSFCLCQQAKKQKKNKKISENK